MLVRTGKGKALGRRVECQGGHEVSLLVMNRHSQRDHPVDELLIIPGIAFGPDVIDLIHQRLWVVDGLAGIGLETDIAENTAELRFRECAQEQLAVQ